MNGRLRVLLVQLPVPNNPALNTPLAAGYLKAYAVAQGLDAVAEIELLPRHLTDYAGDALLVNTIIARQPDVVGISLYTWNSERSLDIIRRVKTQLPYLRVVVGGPEVQKDNIWVLEHPAVDIAVLGEGEQTFADLLLQIAHCKLQGASTEPQFTMYNLQSIAGLVFRDAQGDLVFTPDRVALSDLSSIPSPYLAGYLDMPQDGMLMIEVSRWCPYSCSFCLYGRNMETKLGKRYFELERVLDEIRWGREHGIRRVHFVEANLNLVPLFWPLMRALEDLNADQQMAFYAELRGEHLTDEVVDVLTRAGLKVAEVGLQTANPVALRVAHRRTDLGKWAAGTRRLMRQGIEIYLDVILGLPADDADGVATTLEFIQHEDLGPYDVFTLQVLPGTATRGQADEYRLMYQDRPPYYILGTDRLSYVDLRRLRRELKLGAEIDPDEVEGCPPPRLDALRIVNCILQISEKSQFAVCNLQLVDRLWLVDADALVWAEAGDCINRLASHVDVVARWEDAVELLDWLAPAIVANPATLIDCYLLADAPPAPEDLRAWRKALPYAPGYLDRVAVYRRDAPEPAHDRVSPRCFVVLPWEAQADPADYHGTAEIIWAYNLDAGDDPPLSAWAAAGGAGVWVRGRPAIEVARWREEFGLRLWVE